MDETDFIPGSLCMIKLGPPCPMANEYLDRVKILSEKIKQKKPNVVSHPSFTKVPRFGLYCANEALAIPYVSPMLAESLGNLPPILCQIGGAERFRDSGVFFSFKASDPSKYQLPKYAMTNFANSPFKKPTKVTLEVYDELSHGFQIFPFEKITQFSLKRAYDFIMAPDDKGNVQTTINAIAINPNCDIRELDAKYMNCLTWENIGVVPDVEEQEFCDRYYTTSPL